MSNTSSMIFNFRLLFNLKLLKKNSRMEEKIEYNIKSVCHIQKKGYGYKTVQRKTEVLHSVVTIF